MQVPKTLHDFYEQFPDEESCWMALRQVRWPHGFICPRCAKRGSHRLRTRRLEQRRSGRHQTSVTAGTLFLQDPGALAYLVFGHLRSGPPQEGHLPTQFQRDSGLGSYQTAWTLLHKLRSALGHRPQFRLTGLVEADEAYVGGAVSGGARGRGAPEQGVGCGSRRTTRTLGGIGAAVGGRAGLPGRTRPLRARRHQCRPGYCARRTAGVAISTWGRWSGSSPRRPRRSRPDLILPWIHKVFSNLKTWLRGTFHGVSPKHLPRYLQEFQLPVRSPRTRERTLLLRPAPSRPWRASPLRPTDG